MASLDQRPFAVIHWPRCRVMANRIFSVQTNTDDLSAAQRLCLNAEDEAQLLRGYLYGAAGGDYRLDMPQRWRDGFMVGQAGYLSAKEFQARQSERGKASAAARSNHGWNHGSTTVQPRIEPVSSNPVIHISRDPEIETSSNPPPPSPKGRKKPTPTPESECVGRHQFKLAGNPNEKKAALRAAIAKHGIQAVDATELTGIWPNGVDAAVMRAIQPIPTVPDHHDIFGGRLPTFEEQDEMERKAREARQ